jgi:threonine/homoserine/homoserine lactone efflux protein
LVNVRNPKVALFFLELLPQFIDNNSGPAALQILVLGLLMSLMGMASPVRAYTTWRGGQRRVPPASAAAAPRPR